MHFEHLLFNKNINFVYFSYRMMYLMKNNISSYLSMTNVSNFPFDFRMDNNNSLKHF